MAITDINISETLEAGAPSIKYTGNRDPNQEPDMLMASDPSWEAEWEDLYQSYKLKQIELGQEFVDKETFMDQYQNNMASGGRVNFGLGSIFKGIKKAVKSAVKSPIGKAAILGGLGMYGMGAGPFGKLGGSGFLRGMGPALFGSPAVGGTHPILDPGTYAKKGILSNIIPSSGMGKAALLGGIGLTAATAFEGMEEDEIKALRSNPEALRAHLTQYYSNVNPDLGDEEVSAWVETQMYSTGGRVGYTGGGPTGHSPSHWNSIIEAWNAYDGPMNFTEFYHNHINKAQGGRIGYAGGELVEPDFREKAKDIGGSFWGMLPFGPKQKMGEEVVGDLWYQKYDEGLSKEDAIKYYEQQWDDLIEYEGYKPGQTGAFNNWGIESKDQIREKIEEAWDMVEVPTTDTGIMKAAQGGRIGFAYGPDQTAEAAGIMGKLPVRNNAAGVKELDLRDSGGFIPPVGVKEKADDIPAMLSNNEFVMTADAVRAAGGGSMEKGAQRMYNTMKNLESQVV